MPVKDTGLGILRADDVPVLKRGGQVVTITPELRAFFDEPKTLIITKANVRSRVHRRVYLDYIGVKRFGGDGNAVGEFRIVGLFTSTAYTRSVRTIPYLRRKVDAVLQRAGFDPTAIPARRWSTCWKAIRATSCSRSTRTRSTSSRWRSCNSTSGRACACWRGATGSTGSCRYWSTCRASATIHQVRARIGAYLAEAFKGHVSAFYPTFPGRRLTRVHFIIGRRGGETPDPDRATLEQAVGAIVRTWSDALGAKLIETQEPGRARALFDRYGDAFSEGYREAYPPDDAVEDIQVIESLSPERPLGVEFYPRGEDGKSCVGLKVWSRGRPIPLSERVPVLENMGFRVVDEQTFQVGGEPGAWLHDMVLERADGKAAGARAMKTALESCFIMVMRGLAENDGYNALVMAGGLQWRDVALVRTISRFLRQIRVPYSQDYMWATLRKHAGLAAKIVDLFHARFDPRSPPPSFRDGPVSASTRVFDARSGRARNREQREKSLDSGLDASRRPGMTADGDARSIHEAAIAAEIEEGLTGVEASTRTASSAISSTPCSRRSAPTTISSTTTASRSARSRSSSPAASSTACRCPRRSTRSSSIRRASRACTCASARWRAAASAGRTGRRTSAPRCWGW